MGDFKIEGECTPVKNGYAATFCTALEKSLQYHPTKKSKGLFGTPRINTKTLDRLGIAVAIHSGDFVGRGALLHYCPFCQGALHDLWEKPAPSAAQQGDADD